MQYENFFTPLEYAISIHESSDLREAIKNKALMMSMWQFPNFTKRLENEFDITNILQCIERPNGSEEYLNDSINYLAIQYNYNGRG